MLQLSSPHCPTHSWGLRVLSSMPISYPHVAPTGSMALILNLNRVSDLAVWSHLVKSCGLSDASSAHCLMASWDFGPSSAIGDDKDDATAFTAAAAGSYTNFRFYCITFSTLLHESLPLLHELPTLSHEFLIFFYDFSMLNNSAQTTDSCTDYNTRLPDSITQFLNSTCTIHRLFAQRIYRTTSRLLQLRIMNISGLNSHNYSLLWH